MFICHKMHNVKKNLGAKVSWFHICLSVLYSWGAFLLCKTTNSNCHVSFQSSHSMNSMTITRFAIFSTIQTIMDTQNLTKIQFLVCWTIIRFGQQIFNQLSSLNSMQINCWISIPLMSIFFMVIGFCNHYLDPQKKSSKSIIKIWIDNHRSIRFHPRPHIELQTCPKGFHHINISIEPHYAI